MNVGAVRLSSKTWRLLAVFVLALVVRLVYNLYIAQHRILDVGDSFYYLTDGRSLAKLVIESPSIQTFLSHLCTAAKYVPGSFNSFSSQDLSDRLLIDGPIYPSYLAAIFLLTGKALETSALNAQQLAFALANSVTDALLAVAVAFLGETAFGIMAGTLAGIFWCFYFPAVINTQQCYGEPVVALLLTLFVGAMFYLSRQSDRHNQEEMRPVQGIGWPVGPSVRPSVLPSVGLSAGLAVGALGGLVMLAKPVFVVLPPLLLPLHLIFLAFSGRLRRKPFNLTALFLGVAAVLAPWLLYTGTISGAPRLVVSRAPGYNLFVGNYLLTDGWKTCPVVDGVPDSAADASRFIESEAERQPGAMLSLLLRKIPRLWAGVWNDFHTACFGIRYGAQNIFQALYLLVATIGLAIAAAGRLKRTRPFSFAAAMTMAFAIAFHFIYVLFEPVPRYAFTAMPMVLALAAFGFVALVEALLLARKKLRQRSALQLLFMLGLFVVICACLYAFWTPAAFFRFATSDPAWLRLCAGLLMLFLFVLLGAGFLLILTRLNRAGPISNLVLGKTFVLAGLIALAGALSDPAYLEWSAYLPSWTYGEITTTLSLPDLGKSVPSKVYLLIDAQSKSGAPENLKVMINDNYNISTYPLALYEYTQASKDIPTLLSLQSRMMDKDQRTFRQWWLYPVDSKLFHFGSNNTISLSSGDMKIFGDCRAPETDTAGGETILMPSLTTFSWSKGFLTADCRDPRVYEETYFRGQARGARTTIGGFARDLCGVLRLRLALPMLGHTASQAAETITLFSQAPEKQISGQYPVDFDSRPLALQNPLAPSSILHMHAQMRAANPSIPATMALRLEHGPGPALYSPVWQPSCLRLNREWDDVDIRTVLPPNSQSWQNLTAHLLLSPFSGDRLYLHRKEALKDSIFVRNLKIEILPPPVPGGGAFGALKLI